MRMPKLAVAALVLGLTVISVAFATTVTHSGAGLRFEVPDDWEAVEQDEDDGILTIAAPENQVVLQVWVEEEETIEAALEALGEALPDQFEAVELDEETKEVELHGLPALAVNGTAEKDGTPVKLLIAVVMSEKPVVFLGVATNEGVEAYNEAVSAMFASIHRPED